MKAKTARKSVSFVAQKEEIDIEVVPGKAVVPALKTPLLLLPAQLPLVLYGMIQQGLTKDPLIVMVKGLLTLICVQLAYGYWLASTLKVEDSKKKEGHLDTLNMVVLATVVACVLSNAIFVILVLFGAPLYAHVKETYVLSYHLALIFVQPVLVLYKLRFHEIAALFSLERIYRAIFSNPILSSSALGVLGTWLGVIPIPLDWDRPWQQWPITLLAGGYGGAFAGFVLSLVVSSQY